MKMTELELRPITADELPAFVRADATAFGGHISDEQIVQTRAAFELDHSLAVFDRGAIVATTTAFSFTLTLPGLTTLPVAGASYVAVLPTHRRQGLLRRLMQRQIDDVAARGEAISVLTSSESSIYGRFGYGPATSVIHVEIERDRAAFARPLGRDTHIRLLDHAAAFDLLRDVYDRVRRQQPGALNRTDATWHEILRHPYEKEDTEKKLFYAAAETASGEVEGMAVYEVENRWSDGLPNGLLTVRELFAVTPAAYAALWRFCLDVDLIGTIRAQARPVDEALRWLLAEPRRLRTTRWTDDLWLRLVDVPVALAARRYAATGGIVLDVRDAFRPRNAGCYALDGGPDGATCRATTTAADLALDVADLGAAYLGGVLFGTLARAGRIEELTPGALRRADALFASEPTPWCATPF